MNQHCWKDLNIDLNVIMFRFKKVSEDHECKHKVKKEETSTLTSLQILFYIYLRFQAMDGWTDLFSDATFF